MGVLAAGTRSVDVSRAVAKGFPTVHAAVASAREGDTVLVHPGRYVEEPLQISKRIVLSGDCDRESGQCTTLVMRVVCHAGGLHLHNLNLSGAHSEAPGEKGQGCLEIAQGGQVHAEVLCTPLPYPTPGP